MTLIDKNPLKPEISWNGRRVFITGAAGFVGSWLTESLLTLGARVYALVWPGDDESHWWSFLDQADVEVV
jgi:nucleoside-diphosphate-sugar epimerase